MLVFAAAAAPQKKVDAKTKSWYGKYWELSKTAKKACKIKGNKIARTVKLADLKHNSDLSRLDTVDEKALKRIEKYRQAIALLSEPDPGC